MAARALLAHGDPYLVAGRPRFVFPLYYPLPTLLLLAPLAPLSLAIARVAFAAISGGLFALAALRYGRGLPAALLSACFLNAIILGQWSPLLVVAVVVPGMGFLLSAKPSIGTALLSGFPRWSAAIGGAILLGLSFVLLPSWLESWLHNLGSNVHRAPVMLPGGWILLLGLVRWRSPEGRLLAALACVPQITGLYDALPLFLIPRNKWQGYVLAMLSYVAAFGQEWLFPMHRDMTFEAAITARWPLLLGCLYAPALILVLLSDRAMRSP
ncbi:MAG: hypothetical protein ABIY46_01595 [Gemmatimonadales bacterium]